jgi:hypothetical protein
MKNLEPHPLQPIVMAAFAKQDHHDVSSLAYFFAGAIVRPGFKAYKTVAKDVIGYMIDQGLLDTDKLGWHHLVRRK